MTIYEIFGICVLVYLAYRLFLYIRGRSMRVRSPMQSGDLLIYEYRYVPVRRDYDNSERVESREEWLIYVI
jgi:hypothetical protein